MYFKFLLLRRQQVYDEDPDPKWHFPSYYHFVEHIAAIREQVAEMRREQGLDPDIQSMKEKLLFLDEYLAAKARKPSTGPIFGPVFSDQTPADASRPAEAQPESPTRKRTRDREETEPASGPAPESDKEDGSQGERDPVPKRRKTGRPRAPSKTKTAANPPPKQPRDTKLGRKRGKANTDEAHDIETAQQAAVQGKTGEAGQKRRGRSPKTARADPVPEAPTHGKGQKSKASKERAGVKRRNATTASSATGPRRSARVAAMNQK